jgi:ferrochelatase
MPGTAVVLFNLGGPDSPEAVRPFLGKLFGDPAILRMPSIARWFLSRLIASRRAPFARASYDKIGGRSPLLERTEEQARALESVLAADCARVFVAMRYWHPMAVETAARVAEMKPDRIVLVPLYPQFSSSTTASSFADWDKAARAAGLDVPVTRVCCFPEEAGFIAALVAGTRQRIFECGTTGSPRVLFSAHGVPKKFVDAGDPYQDHIERTAAAIVAGLAMTGLDHVVCYQSRVGRLEWLGPYTDDEIRRAGRDGVPLVVVPIAFVCEHSETLVELDIDYAELAEMNGVPQYHRVPTAGTDAVFINGLARLVALALAGDGQIVSERGGRICPVLFGDCPMMPEGAKA